MTVKPDVSAQTAAHFEAFVGHDFTFQAPPDARGGSGAQTILELLDVSTGRKIGSGRVPFALLFRLKSGPQLGEVLHTILHDAFTPDLLYLSAIVPPMDRDSAQMYYEAVFN
jgi:hypothetical protein